MSSWKALAWAKDQQVGNPVRKLVLILMCEKVDANYSCFPSAGRIAAEAECGRSTVLEHQRALEEMGLIRRVAQYRPNGAQMVNRIYINHPDAPAPEDVPGGPASRTGGVQEPDGGGPGTGRGGSRSRTGGVQEPDPPGVQEPDPLKYPKEHPPTYPPQGQAGRAGEVPQDDQADQGDARAVAFVAALPFGQRRPSAASRTELLAQVTAALAAGWSAAELRRALTSDTADARNLARLYLHRLRDLGQPRRTEPSDDLVTLISTLDPPAKRRPDFDPDRNARGLAAARAAVARHDR